MKRSHFMGYDDWIVCSYFQGSMVIGSVHFSSAPPLQSRMARFCLGGGGGGQIFSSKDLQNLEFWNFGSLSIFNAVDSCHL